MMQPNKVRIGNIFKEEYTEKLIKVIEIRQKSITFSEKFRGKWQANPIELTDDILLNRCGFYKYPALFYKCKVCISIIHGKLYFKFKQGNVEIKYLHQLQNLYFALTCEELEVNLN